MHSNYLETTTCWHAPLPLRMWNRFGRVVTLEVCAGVAPTLIVATVPCPRINQVLSLPIGPSIHVGRAKTSLSGISPNRGMALLTHHGNAPSGGCLHSYFSYTKYATLPYIYVSCVASTTLTSFQWQEGGAQPSLYELLYRILFPTVLPESYS